MFDFSSVETNFILLSIITFGVIVYLVFRIFIEPFWRRLRK